MCKSVGPQAPENISDLGSPAMDACKFKEDDGKAVHAAHFVGEKTELIRSRIK